MEHATMPKVSVIVPNYNHAPYLKERLDSILAQDYTDYELIVLDDASTDDSMTVLDTYAGCPRLRTVMVNETNSGNTFLQWQKGIRAATGDYIWIAESDDVAEPTLLSHLVHALQSANAVLAFAQSRCIDEQGNSLPRRISAPFTHSFDMDGHLYVSRFLLGENTICNASAVLFRREAAISMDMMQVAQFRVSGDRLFWIQMALQGRVAFVAQPLNRFRQHTQKISIAAAGKGINCVQDHQIYRLIRPRLHLTNCQQRMICGYHWQAMRMPWVTKEGLQSAMEEWRQEPLFGLASWLIYKTYRALARMKGTCSI